MSRGVYEIEDVFVVPVTVKEAAGLQFDCYTALFLYIHIVEELFLHFARGNGARLFDEPVRKSALAVVDVCYDAEIAYLVETQCVLAPPAQREFAESVDIIIIGF